MLFQYFFIPLYRNSRYDAFKTHYGFSSLSCVGSAGPCGGLHDRESSGRSGRGHGNPDVVYEDNYPYNYLKNGTLEGITPDLLEMITGQDGGSCVPGRIRLVPWAEGYQAALTGNNTMIFAIARIPSRETSFKWAGPIYPYTTVVFARPDSGIIISSPDDLKAYRIGAVADDAAVQQLVDAG